METEVAKQSLHNNYNSSWPPYLCHLLSQAPLLGKPSTDQIKTKRQNFLFSASELQTECALIIPSSTIKCNFYNCTYTSELLNMVFKRKSENCSLWSCISISVKETISCILTQILEQPRQPRLLPLFQNISQVSQKNTSVLHQVQCNLRLLKSKIVLGFFQAVACHTARCSFLMATGPNSFVFSPTEMLVYLCG